jgi:SMC interacting uncharacterized protein involved in chromosome segregation
MNEEMYRHPTDAKGDFIQEIAPPPTVDDMTNPRIARDHVTRLTRENIDLSRKLTRMDKIVRTMSATIAKQERAISDIYDRLERKVDLREGS